MTQQANMFSFVYKQEAMLFFMGWDKRLASKITWAIHQLRKLFTVTDCITMIVSQFLISVATLIYCDSFHSVVLITAILLSLLNQTS